MKDGETLIFDGVSEAVRMVKPHWNGDDWEETAEQEEIELHKVMKVSSLI